MIKNVIFAKHYEKQSEATIESLFFLKWILIKKLKICCRWLWRSTLIFFWWISKSQPTNRSRLFWTETKKSTSKIASIYICNKVHHCHLLHDQCFCTVVWLLNRHLMWVSLPGCSPPSNKMMLLFRKMWLAFESVVK